MQPNLPAPNEYHRPTLARELRRKADRLDLCCRLQIGSGCVALAATVILYGWMAHGLFELPVQLPTWALLFLTASLGAAGGWAVSNPALSDRARRLRAEADDLDREHAARYGPGVSTGALEQLPAAVPPKPSRTPLRSAR